MIITLTRSASTGAYTEGQLLAGTLQLCTLELPWLNDVQDKSCVPLGQYDLNPYESLVKGLVYRLRNPDLKVYDPRYDTTILPSGRTDIEMHPGNWTSDSLGCILVGKTFGELRNPKTGDIEHAVVSSQEAMAELRRVLGSIVTHMLVIQGPQP